jgi:membrane-bound metal-dependent hydrolase YbcI (DUF457 family)
MMGSSHATSGLLVGLATLPVAPVAGPAASTAWVAAWGGFALLPDLDTDASTAARLWGPLTRAPARGIGILARGHRAGTHDVLVAPAVAAAVSALAPLHPGAAFVFLTVAVGLALVAVDPIVPGDQGHPLANLVVSCAVAWWVTRAGVVPWWLPIAAAGGVVVHIVGDAVTTAGVPVPLSTWRGRRGVWGPRLFRTGSPAEAAVATAMWVCIAWTAYLYLPDRLPEVSPDDVRDMVIGVVSDAVSRIPEPGFLR